MLGAYFYPAPVEGEANVHEEEGRKVGVVERMKKMVGLGGENGSGGSGSGQMDTKFRGETKTVVVSVMSRMVLTPMVLMPLMVLFTKFDVHRVFDEYVSLVLCSVWELMFLFFPSPVFVVANVLLISSPPALTLAQVCVIFAWGPRILILT